MTIQDSTSILPSPSPSDSNSSFQESVDLSQQHISAESAALQDQKIEPPIPPSVLLRGPPGLTLRPTPKEIINGIAPHVLDERRRRPQRRNSNGKGRPRIRPRTAPKQNTRNQLLVPSFSSPLRVSGAWTCEDVQAQVDFVIDTRTPLSSTRTKHQLLGLRMKKDSRVSPPPPRPISLPSPPSSPTPPKDEMKPSETGSRWSKLLGLDGSTFKTFTTRFKRRI